MKLKGWILALIPFLFIACILIYSPLEHYQRTESICQLCRYISYPLLFTGILEVTLSLLVFRQKITPHPAPSEGNVLRKKGIYSLIRHPMYSSVLFFSLGYVMYFSVLWILIFLLLLIISLLIKINFEEKMLLEIYPEYREYQSRTKKLIPYIF